MPVASESPLSVVCERVSSHSRETKADRTFVFDGKDVDVARTMAREGRRAPPLPEERSPLKPSIASSPPPRMTGFVTSGLACEKDNTSAWREPARRGKRENPPRRKLTVEAVDRVVIA